MLELPSTDRFRPLRLDAAARIYFGLDSGVSGKTLRALGNAGRLKVYKIAGKLFTSLADLDAMVKGSTVERSPPTQPQPVLAQPASAEEALARAQKAIANLRDR
jgi:hypothetical protein